MQCNKCRCGCGQIVKASFAKGHNSRLYPAGGRKPVPVNERFHDKYTKNDNGCWLWKAKILPNGYGCIKHDRKDEVAHRISWILHYGSIPDGLFVLHRCDVRNCVNPRHLFLGTHLDNVHDCVKKRRQSFLGERNPKARLTLQDVICIRQSNSSMEELSKKYGVVKSTILKILQNETWSEGNAAS